MSLLSRLGPEAENERQRIRQQFEADAGSYPASEIAAHFALCQKLTKEPIGAQF